MRRNENEDASPIWNTRIKNEVAATVMDIVVPPDSETIFSMICPRILKWLQSSSKQETPPTSRCEDTVVMQVDLKMVLRIQYPCRLNSGTVNVHLHGQKQRATKTRREWTD